MKGKLTSLLLTALLSVAFFAQTSYAAAPSRATDATDDPFAYVITSPAEGDETFRSIDLQFPKATSVEYVPSFMDRPGYIEFKKNGETFPVQYAYPALDENVIKLDLGGAQGSTADRWEVTLKPGLFNLLDADENVIATNPLMEIVVTEGAPKSDVDFSFTTDPADPDGKLLLDEMSKVSFTFPGLSAVSADADAAVVALGETTVDKSAYTVSASENVVTVNFEPALTSAEDAALTVTFPEEALTGTQGETSGTNKTPVKASYTIVPAAAYDLAIDFYKPKPDADGNISAYESFTMPIFICDNPDVKAVSGSEATIIFKEVNGDFQCTGTLTTLTGMVSGKSTFYALLNQPVYNGAYTITIPKGAAGDTRWRADHTLGHSNDEIVLSFNLVGGIDRPKEEDPFEYVITSPAEGDETFSSIDLQFPKATSVAYVPSFMDRPDYIEFKKNGETFPVQYAYPALDENVIKLDLGGAQGNTADRWEVILQPGLFNLLDADENVIATNPLMEIVVTEGAPKSDVDFSFTTDPDGELLLAEMSKVSFTFSGLSAVSADADAAVVTLGETTIDKSAYTVSASENVVTVNFEPALTSAEDAALTVTFPEEALTGTQGETSGTNKTPVKASYTIVPAAAYDLAIDFYKPKPDADGNISAYESFTMPIFICDNPDVKAVSGSEATIIFKEVNGDFQCTGTLTTLTGMVSGKSTFYALLNQPVYNGAYTITIPKGAAGDTRWRADHTLGHSNDEIVLSFNLVGGIDRPVETPHIDLSTAYVGTEVIAVKGVPSEDNIYWYANIIEASRYPGDKEMFESVINFFKTGAETFNMDWITVYQMTAKKGTYTWGFGDLYASQDYIVYAMGLDENGELYMPMTKINVRTADQIVSDNTFTVETVSIEDGTQPETKKLTIKVTPSNDDSYAAVILEKYITDGYDLTSEADEKNYLRNALRPLVTEDKVYTGEQTIVFDNIKIDAIMQAAVFGYEEYETTSATLTDFSTVDENFEAMFIEAYDPSISGASASIYSFDMVRPYIFGVISKGAAAEMGGIETIHENYNIPKWTAAGMGYYDWRYYARRDLNTRPLDGTLSEIGGYSALKWDTEYYIYAYLMDNGGYRTSPVYYAEFTTESRNKTDNTFELKLNSITSNAQYSSETFTADMTIIPGDASAPYALYYGETYDFEEYLAENRLDDWMYDVFMQRRIKRIYNGELNFGFGNVYPDKKYILVVTGFDEAPNTEPVWMLFNKDGEIENTSSGISYVKDNMLRIYADGLDICIDGEFSDAQVYGADGIMAGAFTGNKCSVNAPGYYIVRVQTVKGIVTRKIAVK